MPGVLERCPHCSLIQKFNRGRQYRQTRPPRLVTVIRLQNLTIVTFTEKDFDLMSGTYSAIAMEVIRKFARLLSLRIRQTSSRLAALM